MKKAPGDNNKTDKQLMELSNSYINYLTNFTNAILMSQSFPDQWKIAIVMLIL